MTEWKADERTRKTIGPYTVVSERCGSLTAHRIGFPDGRGIRALPDDHNSGQKRSRTISEALTALASAADATHGFPLTEHVDVDGRPIFDPVVYLVGALTVAGIIWESTGGLEVSIEEWLTDWLKAPDTAAGLIYDLDQIGFEIRRKEQR